MPVKPTPVPVITSLSATAGALRLTINYSQTDATTIQYKVNTGSYLTVNTATSGSFNISGLTAGVAYTITLLCSNSAGSDTATVTGTPVNVPTNVVVSVATTKVNTATVSYTYTANGLTMTNAKYIIEPSGSVTTTAPNISVGTATQFDIWGLTGGVTYYVRMTLTNSAGTSAVSTNAICTVIGFPSKPVISSIGTTTLDTLDINYTSSYYGPDPNVLTAYSDFTTKILNPTFATSPVVIPANSYATVTNIPNWLTYLVGNGAVYIGNGATSYAQTPPSTVSQYCILTSIDASCISRVYRSVYFEPGDYQFTFTAYRQNPVQGDEFKFSVWIPDASAQPTTVAIVNIKYIYEYNWMDYNIGFTIPVAGTYFVIVSYSNTAGNQNSISFTNAYILKGISPSNPDLYTNSFNNYQYITPFTTLANNSSTFGTGITNWNMSSSYIAKGTTTYATANSNEGYIVLSNNATATLNEPMSSGSWVLTFSACTKYASSTTDILTIGDGLSDGYKSIKITSTTWKTYSTQIDITKVVTTHNESWIYSDGRKLSFTFQSTNATQPNYLSIKDMVIKPILLYTPTNLSIQPPLSLTCTGFQSYDVQVMIHNKVGGRSLLSDPITAIPHSVPSVPIVTAITCTVSQQLNIFWQSTAPLGTTITNIAYSKNSGPFHSAGISNPIVVTGLSGGVMYNFKLEATNQYGTSMPSISYYGTPIDRLTQPTITSITEPSKNTIAVYWKDDLHDLLDDTNGLVISEIKYSLDNGATYISAGTQNPIILSGLSGGVYYPVKIIANNATSGDSVESLVSYGMPYDAPAKPTITSITATTSKQLNVYWTDISNGAVITSIKYSIDGSTPNIDASLTNPFIISGLTGGTSYQIRIITTNTGGSSSASDIYTATPFDVPSKPSILSVTYVNRNYYVSWSDASNGAAITDIKYSLNESNPYISAGTTNPFPIGDLSSGYTYPLKIQAINSAGGSTISDTYTITATGGGSGLPDLNVNTPSILDVSGGNKSISVYFIHTETVGYPVITYQYQLNNGPFLNSEYKTSPLVITGLTNSNLYTVKMTAINATGTSSASNSSSAVMPHSVPDKPILISVDASDSKLICLIEPANNNGGTLIEYKYSINNSEYALASDFTPDISVNKVIIDNLTNGTLYSVSIKQVNEYGESLASNTITDCIPYGYPTAPIIISSSVSSTQASLNYTGGNGNGYPILFYEYSINNGTTYTPISSDSSLNQFTIYGLSPHTQYFISMRSTNAKCNSTSNGNIQPYTPYIIKTTGVVSAPLIVSVVPGNNCMTVNFVNGDLTGSFIGGYTYSINSEAYITLSILDPNVSDTSILFNGLINGNTYSICIKTVTTNGISPASNTIYNIIPYSAPDTPIITNVVVISKQATIYFTTGNNNGYPLTKIEYSLDNGSTYTTAPFIDQPFTIYELIDGSSYTIKLRSVHEKSSSGLSTGYTFTPSDLPSPPTINKVVAGNHSLYVYYYDGNLNGGTFLNYSISINDGSYIDISQNDISGDYIIINNLTNGTKYNISMKSVTTKGTSSSSNLSENNIPYDIPSTPIITEVLVYSGYAMISFTQDSSNGYPILGYTYTLDGTNYKNAPGYAVSPIALYGFTDGSQNTIQIKAYHTKGTSLASNAVSFTTQDKPNAPLINSITPGNTTLMVNFLNTGLKGGTISGYSVSINGGTYNNVPSQDVSGSCFIIRNLTNGTKYSVSMKTITNVGTSLPSNIINNIIPFTNPSAPTITNIITSNKTANVLFTPGEANGYPILGYKVSINGSDYINATWDTSSSEITVYDLSNGISTTISIRAYNAIGESSSSNTYTFIINQLPDAPTITNIEAGDSIAIIEFQNNNLYGSNIIKYAYSLDRINFIDVSSSDISGNTIKINGLTNGESYSISMCITTVIGTSLESNIKNNIIPFSAPTAPIISSVIAGNKMAIVSFQPSVSYSTEYNIINYQYSLDGGNTFNWCSSIIDNSFEIIGLTPKVQYSVIIRAYSKIGYSANSAASSNFIPYGTPSTPIITNVVPSNEHILVYISTPESNGSDITSYLYSLNGEEYLTTTDITSPITILGLINKKSYIITLKAVNSAGASDASLPSSSVIPFYIPDTPIIANVRPINGSAIVDLSATDLNGDTIIGYKYSFNESVWYDASAIPSSPLSFIITGLTNGISYTVYVKIVSLSGITAASSISQSFVPRNVPNPPIITSITPADKSALLYFKDSSSNGSPIKEYWYSANSSSYRLALQHTSPITIYGLTNGVPTTVKVKAVNDAGFSAESIQSSQIIPFGVPATPFIRNAYPGNGSALVYFDEINSNGVPIEKIQYSMGPSWIDLSANTSPFLIPGLTNKTGPSVSIRAKNSAGYSYSSNIVRIMVGTPYPPVITNVVSGNKQITVYFTTSITNSPITAVYYNFVGSSTAPLKAIGTTSPIIIPKLTNGTSYSVKLQLANLNGYSLESAPSDPIIPAGVPNKLTITSSARNNINEIILSIATPIDNGSPITKYKYSINSDTTLYDISGTNNQFVISGLEPNLTYSFKMYAENIVGISPVSAASRPIVNTYMPPLGPTKISAVAKLNQLSVSFIPPTTPLFLPITTYLYCLNGNGTSSDVYVDASTSQLPLLIPINNNTSYTVRIKAVNVAGVSTTSSPTPAVSYIYLPPTYPAIKSVLPIGNGTAYITYTPSVARNSPITGYSYTLDPSQAYIPMEMSGSILIATGLPNNVLISNLQIAANSSLGYSVLSRPAISFTILYSAPSSPVLSNPIVSGRNVNVGFSEPASNGSPITEYTYTLTNTITKTETIGTTSSIPILLSNLSNGSYSIVVKAKNNLGTSANSANKTFIINVV